MLYLLKEELQADLGLGVPTVCRAASGSIQNIMCIITTQLPANTLALSSLVIFGLAVACTLGEETIGPVALIYGFNSLQ